MTELAHAISMALLHFVWQGILVAFVLWVALAMLGKPAGPVALCAQLRRITRYERGPCCHDLLHLSRSAVGSHLPGAAGTNCGRC